MLNRRSFALLGAATLFAPQILRAETLVYTPGLVQERLNAGETLFLDFYAPWCSTCRAQQRVIGALKSENPAYEQKITFIQVDWDTYGDSELAKSLNIPRRSTLVVLKGNQRLGQVIAGTGRAEIKALLDTALNAAG